MKDNERTCWNSWQSEKNRISVRLLHDPSMLLRFNLQQFVDVTNMRKRLCASPHAKEISFCTKNIEDCRLPVKGSTRIGHHGMKVRQNMAFEQCGSVETRSRYQCIWSRTSNSSHWCRVREAYEHGRNSPGFLWRSIGHRGRRRRRRDVNAVDPNVIHENQRFNRSDE